jgi:hypothetical protein
MPVQINHLYVTMISMNEKYITTKNIKKERGIHLDGSISSRPYRVQFTHNGKKRHFGFYKTLEEAVLVRDKIKTTTY